MVILGPDVRCIQAKVEAALSAFRPPLSSPAPKDSFKRIIDLLRGEFHITASLSATVGGLREQFFQLEKEQVAVLDFFEQNRRVIVEGCAGSGKTLIAIEKAARAVRGGKRVLMLCFNIPLAEAVRARAVERGIAVDIFHFHGLAEQVVRAAGGEFPRKGSEPKGFWNEGCAELLDAALPLFPGRYDCIIVDEAQDFVEDWWIPILKLLADENAGEFYIFLDPGQNIFGRKFEAPFDGLRITLNTNYRNTPAIAKWLNNVFQTGIKPNDRLDEGVRPVEIRVKDDQSELFEIKNIVDGLVNKEKLNPGQIVILGQHALKYSIFRDAPKIGKHPIIETALPIQDEGTIRYSSIYRFKGLEAECVILCGVGATPRKDIGENLKSLLLAGASRAKILLYILHRYQGSER
jgi:superfamily I DNA/RNA helicase